MDVSLGALRERLLEMRAWDSSGSTFDKRVRSAINTALDRLAGDVPEALVPDEEHVVLRPETVSTDHNLAINAAGAGDSRVLRITDKAGQDLGVSAADDTAEAWYANTFKSDGTWDGIMHLEVKDPSGTWHRRQSREWWVDGNIVYVSLDRPWPNTSDSLMAFRIYQPEFFMRDDVMQVLEPARIWDSTRQQVWAVDTAGAYRQDMVDFQGETKGRPYRFYRNRHFQVPPPRSSPRASFSTRGKNPWRGPWQQGIFSFVYTYVWGKREDEWQQSPMGTNDPVWESAPSPISNVVNHGAPGKSGASIEIQMTNIDQMLDFGATSTTRVYRSGYRLRIYVARTGIFSAGGTPTAYNNVEKAGIYYLLTEINPNASDGMYRWDGTVIPDYHRPLKHSTGYFAYKPYPQHDARYELDFRVLRLPRKFVNDQDTAPIQRDAVPALIELSLYYLCLQDGADQTGAAAHLSRYEELARRYRLRYANPGRAVEPVPLDGTTRKRRFGTFSSSTD